MSPKSRLITVSFAILVISLVTFYSYMNDNTFGLYANIMILFSFIPQFIWALEDYRKTLPPRTVKRFNLY
jgi:hypothetical protein